MFLQIQRRSDDFNTTFQFCTKKRHQRRAHTSRSSCAGDIFHINMQRFFNNIGIVREVIVQLDNHRLTGSLLWAKDARSTTVAD
ncbi:Uncharacterised protein [Klebsiella pneumoniae]|nr:Uncharacterised protein [Klebsiella pneumoniae]